MMTWAVVRHVLVTSGRWLRENAAWVSALLLGAFFGARLIKRKDSGVSSLKEALAVERAHTQLSDLKADHTTLLTLDAASAERDVFLQTRKLQTKSAIAAKQRAILALHNKEINPAGMTDAQVEEVFRDAGL